MITLSWGKHASAPAASAAGPRRSPPPALSASASAWPAPLGAAHPAASACASRASAARCAQRDRTSERSAAPVSCHPPRTSCNEARAPARWRVQGVGAGLHRRRRAVSDCEHCKEPRPPVPRDIACHGSARAARHCAGARGGGSCRARTALRGRCVPEQVGKDPEKLLHLLRLERKQGAEPWRVPRVRGTPPAATWGWHQSRRSVAGARSGRR